MHKYNDIKEMPLSSFRKAWECGDCDKINQINNTWRHDDSLLKRAGLGALLVNSCPGLSPKKDTGGENPKQSPLSRITQR